MSRHVFAITPGLVAWLDELFPDRCPKADMSDREVWMAAGAAAVVRKLRHEMERRQSEALLQGG